jgi:hypothetical protein
MVTLPRIHLNGTSARALMDEIREAHTALTAARDALSNMTVHGRDHYICSIPFSFSLARDEHCARIASIDKIIAEIGELYQGIVDQT